MNRIRGGAAAALGVALLLAAGGVARAQETTGRVTGRVTDKDSGMALGGVTVVLQGPQGEDATLTDDKGVYHFTSLPVGPYVIRFYVANAAAQVEQGGVMIAADKMVRVNAKIASAVQAQAQEKYVITGKPPVVDIGSARVGAEFNSEFMENVPLGPHLRRRHRARPGRVRRSAAATSRSAARPASRTSTSSTASTSPASSTATSRRERRRSAAAPTCRWSSCSRSTSARAAIRPSLGGGMGGVVNSVLKSGSNEFHGSAFSYWAPYWMRRRPEPDHHRRPVARLRAQARLRHQHRRRGRRADHQGQAVLLGRLRAALPELARVPADLRAAVRPDRRSGRRHRTRTATRSQVENTGLARAHPRVAPDVLLRRDPRLDSPPRAPPDGRRVRQPRTSTTQMRVVQRRRVHLQPGVGAGEADQDQLGLHRALDVEAVRSPLADRRPAPACTPNTSTSARRTPALNNRNQLEYWGANLWDLEHAPGCENVGPIGDIIF